MYISQLNEKVQNELKRNLKNQEFSEEDINNFFNSKIDDVKETISNRLYHALLIHEQAIEEGAVYKDYTTFYIPYTKYHEDGKFIFGMYNLNNKVTPMSTWYEYNGYTQIGLKEFDLEDQVNLKDVIKELDIQINRCPFCGKLVGIDNMNHVAFADYACDNCVDRAREQLETPGWYN